MKKIKFILMSLLLIALSSCNINSSSSSSAITSNSTSISTNSSSQEKIWGSVPDNVKVYTELEAIEHMQSPSYVQFEEMYVSGIIASSKYSSNNGKYTITFKNGFQIYQGYLINGLPSLKVGDEIVASGKSMIYENNIYELGYDKSHKIYPTIIKLIRKEIVHNDDDSSFNSYGFPIIEVDIDDYNVIETGIYNTKEEVSIYIYLYGTLPSNYRTKSQFNKSDYTKENKLSTGGDRFYNKEGILPDIPNIKYIEADIDYTGGGRNAKRIVYSADPLLIFYTSDHYLSYSIMKVVE
jgi:hypothetical protein